MGADFAPEGFSGVGLALACFVLARLASGFWRRGLDGAASLKTGDASAAGVAEAGGATGAGAGAGDLAS